MDVTLLLEELGLSGLDESQAAEKLQSWRRLLAAPLDAFVIREPPAERVSAGVLVEIAYISKGRPPRIEIEEEKE